MIDTRRRLMLHFPIAYGTTLALSSLPTSAVIPVLAKVAIRVLLGTALRAAATRVVPAVGATAVRRYLLNVAIAYGIGRTEAEAIAAEAAQSGATNLIKANDARSKVEIHIQNLSDRPVAVSGLGLELVDLASANIEDKLELHIVRVRPSKTYLLAYGFDFLKTAGPKELRAVTSAGDIMDRSERFFAVV